MILLGCLGVVLSMVQQSNAGRSGSEGRQIKIGIVSAAGRSGIARANMQFTIMLACALPVLEYCFPSHTASQVCQAQPSAQAIPSVNAEIVIGKCVMKAHN